MRRLILFSALIVVSACTKETPAPAAKPAAPAPTAAAAPAAPSGAGLKGKVAEKLDVPNYSYLRLETSGGSVWAAVPTSPVAVGAEVTIANPMEMKNFESKALNRTFDSIMFGSAVGDGAAAQAPAGDAPHGGGMGLGMGGEKPTVDLANIKVAKADGADARTIAELFAQKADLKDKTVAIRGKVVKMTGGVMGKNWLHLRDGSGTDASRDNDITVTSVDVASINDEVTVRGTVHLDKDLGSGYQYPVIIEDAKVTK